MKKAIPQCLITLLLLFHLTTELSAQCTTGWNSATIKWDNLDYLTRNGTYNSFVTNQMRDTQYFAIGVNRVKIQLNTITTNGENTTNAADAAAFSAFADVEYGGQGSIVLTFDTVVRNLQFKLYDIDVNQRANVTATDPLGNPLNITMSAMAAGIVTVSASATSPTASANGTAANNTDTRGTVSVSIAGTGNGVKQVRITISNASDVFWLSDITACIYGGFPANYYVSQKPFTNQPAYYLVTPDNNSVYLFNPLTGKSDWLFSEPSSPWVNSMAYDFNHKIVYYVRDNPSPLGTNKMLKKYDLNTETVGVVVNDLTTLGIPLFDIVVESAGAAYYNGSLFIGVEGTNNNKNSSRESIIWRIDFDPVTLNPTKVCQVFARPADNGSGTLTHDWGDFIIKDGVLYDFNTGNVGNTSQFVHFNMQNGTSVNYNTNGNPAPIQAGQTWDGKLYWTGGQSPELGKVALYNENGTIGTKINATVTACSPAWVGRAGDASDPFKPKSDFGDAPASYDPTGNDPATHEYDCNLRLGATFDREWNKTASADATADGSDEDGIGTVTILTPGLATFVQDVKVYNHTGSNATLVAWLDYNGNGLFEPSEGLTMTIPSSTATQTRTLSWSVNVPLPSGSTTFLRLRLATPNTGNPAINLTTSKPNGWLANGEVEDYEVFVSSILPVQLTSFTARNASDQRVLLHWTSENEINFNGFDIERSSNGTDWTKIDFVPGNTGSQTSNSYNYFDNNPADGKSWYRLKLIDLDGNTKYSWIISVDVNETTVNALKIMPNPINTVATIRFSAANNEAATIYMVNSEGKRVLSKAITCQQGNNQVTLNVPQSIAAGVYVIQVVTPSKTMNVKALVRRN